MAEEHAVSMVKLHENAELVCHPFGESCMIEKGDGGRSWVGQSTKAIGPYSSQGRIGQLENG